jgi:hypothetical protein
MIHMFDICHPGRFIVPEVFLIKRVKPGTDKMELSVN